ncbi:MAG: T9SS type B sorting domain-containing protein [Flavobacteriaceae bacterium]|nr:T9SS type B sorting domain-containing protein [Flavobacteriaceae bacterium]
MNKKLSFLKIKISNNFEIIFLLLFSFSPFLKAQAQLGLCTGNSGDPIFTENFGTGLTNSPLPAGTTTYTYAPTGYPNNGDYTVRNNTISNGLDWHQLTEDHTVGDTNGKFLIIQADQVAGEFYRTTVSGLCETTTYEFSAWVINLVIANSFCSRNGGTIPINVRFEIWDSTDTNRLAFGDTGNIVETLSPIWREYGLVFQTFTGQNEVILKMINNGQGGCGNDLAIDDIEFKSCGDTVQVVDSNNNTTVSLCSSQTPLNTILTATPDGVVYSSHFYQWQQSTDLGVTWTDIVGQTNQTLSISVSNTTYYRAKIAEVAINLSNSSCVSFSNEYKLNVTILPVMPTLACWETATINNATCSWEVTGSQPTQPPVVNCWDNWVFNPTTCIWDNTGTQPPQPPVVNCWDNYIFNTTTCVWDNTGLQPTQPPVVNCWDNYIFNTTTCVWDNTGSQPAQPPIVNCWDNWVFNTTACIWDNNGTQPVQSTTACYETATFNTSTCIWDVIGTQPVQPTLACWETATFNNTTCSWDITGTQPIQPTLACYETTTFNTSTCVWDVVGSPPIQPNLQCWEIATLNDATCSWEVTGTQPIQPNLECWETATFNTITCSWDVTGTQPGNIIEENLDLCENTTLNLLAQTNISNPTFIWSTGAITNNITINSAGTFTVDITGGVCSFETRIFNVTLLEKPIIENVISDGNDIIITTSKTGDFIYSLDGNIFQSSNVFSNVEGGLYNIFVKQQNCISTISLQYLHFYIPKFFTPNNDGVKDTFSLAGIEFYSSSEVSIFDRYGKLLKFSKNSSLSWDGTFRGENLPSDDYWYVIVIEGKKFTGHFTLKR